MNSVYTKKSGGGISTSLAIVLSIVLFLMGMQRVTNQSYQRMYKDYKKNLEYHYTYLECIYYIRIELYDETYYDMKYENDSFKIKVNFHQLKDYVDLTITSEDEKNEYRFYYDKDNHCIIKELWNDEIKEYEEYLQDEDI